MIYSTRLLAVHDQPAIVQATFTVPAGKTLVVRDIDIYYGTSLSVREVFAVGSAGQIFWYETVDANLAGWRQWTGREVFYETEVFGVYGSDVLDITASGYLLS